MKFQLNIIVILILICACGYTIMEINSGYRELKRNVLKFSYGINKKYEGTLSHSFDRFYVVAKSKLPKVEDLEFTTISCDAECKHLDVAEKQKRLFIRSYQ